MLKKELIEFLYEAAHIQRWNDHIRPSGFTELDKQAHKMMILYVLAKYEEEDHNAKLNWRVLIEGGIIEFMHRIVLTDIKPPIFHELMRVHKGKINEWVLKELKRKIPGLGTSFISKFEKHFEDDNYYPLEKKLLKAAHYLATEWEFNIIYDFNKRIYGIERTREAIANEIEDHYNLAGVQKLALKGKTSKFIDLVGQLRFQKRWAQSPRIPETSVMGHVLIVAMLAYFCSVELKAKDDRIVNNFLCGLFHDLPEVLTRDIISPVKRSIEGLDELIKDIEGRQVAEKIFPLIPQSWHKDIDYYTQNEFANKCKIDGKIKTYKTAEELVEVIKKDKNGKVTDVIDGAVLKGCDNLAAFVEAYLSIQYGITSKHLAGAVESIKADYKNRKIGGIDFGKIYNEFK